MSKAQSSLQFTPRQVVMAIEPQAKKEKKEKSSKKGSSEVQEGSKEIISNGGDLAARGKGIELLLRSIAGFLESNGFKKTLAMFQSEAQIEENSWKSPVVNLNDFVAKFLDSSDVLAVPAIESDKHQDAEKKTRKEKRSKKSSEELKQTEDKREEANQEKNGEKKDSETSDNQNVKTTENDKKKEKKKKKKEVEQVNGNAEENAASEERNINEEKKEKKKRKESGPSGSDETETGDNTTKRKDKEGKKKKKKDSEVGKEAQEKEGEKVSDKETKVENTEKTVSKKRKKGEGEEENVENDGKKRKLVEANGSSEIAPEEKMNGAKSGKKEKQSAEPKAANAFKRVKIEEVKFVDERLQDNSYWAKDGADSGYGAKAQQILEQVRGRDFRHEKTKKKRGTYRGGQIDLQSHSIKFNYSDEE